MSRRNYPQITQITPKEDEMGWLLMVPVVDSRFCNLHLNLVSESA
jgi:hypothetical protein